MFFIDLFAGAGGLSEGFLRQGFIPVGHVEMDKYAALTLKTRMAYYALKEQGKLKTYKDYLMGRISREELYKNVSINLDDYVINKEISDETITEVFERIKTNMKTLASKKIDVLIGGPPCQAYSLVGRARDPYGKEHDPRNYLYKQYVKFLEEFEPSLFVFENVPGILTAGKGHLFDDVKKYMDEAGYDIEPMILDASDFGVLQKRKRVILIGWRKDSCYSPPVFQPIENSYQVKDLLSDLPTLEPGQAIDYGNYRTPATKYLIDFKIRELNDVLTQHITRPHNSNDLKIYKMAIEMWEKNRTRLKYTDVPKKLRTHKNLNAFLDRFKVVAADERYSHTMVAHIAKDGHYYIHPDKEQLRSLSVREAARIQSFPDNFYFEGPRTAVFTQIGNAVPPLMAEEIAKKMGEMLNQNYKFSNQHNNRDEGTLKTYLS